MIPLTSYEQIGYPTPVYDWKNNAVVPSKYSTYFDPRQMSGPMNSATRQNDFIYDPVPSFPRNYIEEKVISPFAQYGLAPPPPVINISASSSSSSSSNYSSSSSFSTPVIPNPNMTTLFSPVAVTVGSNWFEYDDVNTDPELRNRVVRYFRDKMLEYLNEDGSDLLGYFTVKKKEGGDIVEFNKTGDDHKDSASTKLTKIEYIRYNIMSKKFIAKTLEHYTEKKNMKWWDLKANKHSVERYIYSKLKDKISNMGK